MPKFVAILDFTDDKELIARTRPAHRDYLQAVQAAGKIWASGPFVDDTGAMLVFEVEDLAEAERLLDEDPYREAGVMTNARVKAWRVVIAPPVGGEG